MRRVVVFCIVERFVLESGRSVTDLLRMEAVLSLTPLSPHRDIIGGLLASLQP